eukprot:284199_1
MEILTFRPTNVVDSDDSKQSKDQKLFCEVQAIVLAHYSTYDIHPLLQKDNTGKDQPKFLLPFANQPIITYPLRLLEINGFTDILIVITDNFAEDLINFLETYEYYDNGSDLHNITPITVNEEDLTEIQVLKQIHKYIKTDFLMIRCDIFTNAPLQQLLHIHRRENASITLLLSNQTKKKTNNKKRKPKRKSKNTHIIGTDRKHHQKLILKGHPKEIERLWYMKARADLEDEDEYNHKKHDEPQLILNKKLLDYIPHIRFTTKFKLQQIGIFCRWILLWILEDAPKEYELLYEEAVPHLIDMQAEINYQSQQINTQELIDDSQSVITNESNKGGFDFPDLMRRSEDNTEEIKQEDNRPKLPAKLQKQSSHYTSGHSFLSSADVLGNDYMKIANQSASSLPRQLLMKNMGQYNNSENIKTFDDAKSDITAISMSAISTFVNAPNTPRTNTNEMDKQKQQQQEDIEPIIQSPPPSNNKSSPLAQHISTLPTPEHLATVDDIPKMADEFLVKQQSQFLNDNNEDKLKVFGYVYGEDNDNGYFSCIINNSDSFLILSMHLINSIIKFEQKQIEIQNEKNRQNNNYNKRERKRNRKYKQQQQHSNYNKNEEREEYNTMREFEHNCLLHLICKNNEIYSCKEQNNTSIIKNGCIISANCIIGNKT